MTKLHSPVDPDPDTPAPTGYTSPRVDENSPSQGLERRKSRSAESILELRNRQVARSIQEQLLKEAEKDSSPKAKAARRRILFKAVYGEFMCSLIFFTCVFGFHASADQNDWNPPLVDLTNALVSGFQAIACIFAFSSVSGAQFNPATSTALWVTGKLSNRRWCLYVIVQLCASVMSMVLVAAMFSGDLHDAYVACTVLPSNPDSYAKIFATEFFLTFLLVYTGFTVAFENAEQQKKDTMSFQNISNSKGLTLFASTPQSKTGFAPFSIGLMLFAIQMCSATSNGAFNPGRMFGPAIFAGRFEDTYIYWTAEVLGACCAGLMVTNLHRIGYDMTAYRVDEEQTATEEIRALEQQVLDDNVRSSMQTINPPSRAVNSAFPSGISPNKIPFQAPDVPENSCESIPDTYRVSSSAGLMPIYSKQS